MDEQVINAAVETIIARKPELAAFRPLVEGVVREALSELPLLPGEPQPTTSSAAAAAALIVANNPELRPLVNELAVLIDAGLSQLAGEVAGGLFGALRRVFGSLFGWLR